MTLNHRLAVFVCFLVAVASGACGQTPPTVGRDTTYYLGPLDDEGYVDYLSALEQAFGDADTANEDNAFVGIFENVDMSNWYGDWYVDYVAALRKRLQLEPPAEGAVLFTSLPAHAVEHGFSREDANELFDAALDGALDKEHAWLVADWLAAMEVPLARISEAVQRPNYFAPMILDPSRPGLVNVMLPQLGEHRMIARTLSLRINRNLASDELQSAVEDITTLHRLARLQTRETCLISSLVGISIEALAFDSTQSLLSHDKITAAHVEQLKASFASLPQARPIGAVISVGERAIALDVVQQIVRGRVAFRDVIVNFSSMGRVPENEANADIDPFYELVQDPRFDQDAMLRTVNAYWDRYLSGDVIGDYFALKADERSEADDAFITLEIDQAEVDRLAELGWSGISKDADAEAISCRLGDLILRLTTPALNAAARTAAANKTLHQLEEVGLALASYKLAKGEYPPLLLSLVPAYLDAVPLDPFTGKQLIYRREGAGYVLYSVSSDREDDGGLDDRSEGDLVLRVDEPVSGP